MKAAQTSISGPARIARLHDLVFRWSWGTLAGVLVVLYLGWGAFRIWGLLPLISAWFVYRISGSAPGTDPVGRWKYSLVAISVTCALGALFLPLRPDSEWLEKKARSDTAVFDNALERVSSGMKSVEVKAASAIADSRRGLGVQERLDSLWPEVRTEAGGDGAVIALIREEGSSIAWVGSPYLVPVISTRSQGIDKMLVEEDGKRFVTTGDSLAALAFVVSPLPEGTLVIGSLLARDPSAPGPAPGVRPLLEQRLARRIVKRLVIVPADTEGGGSVRVELGPWTPDTIPYPARGLIQTLMLLALLISSFGLLEKDSSVLRGLSAAPLIYASAVPLLLGVAGKPLTLELVSPSWTGHQLINQAFIAVAAAALALWFAVRIRDKLTGYLKGIRAVLFTLLLLVTVALLWVLGFALLQDLFRFAPSWFWAKVSFLPAASDLVGWLIAIAMTLAVIGGAGGIAAAIISRFSNYGLVASGLAAIAGGVGAGVLNAWDGSIAVGALVALAGTLMAGFWLGQAHKRSPLTVLLGVGFIGAIILLPVKSSLGHFIIRNVIEESADTLAGPGAGLNPAEVMALRRQLTMTAAETRETEKTSVPLFEVSENRQAYLLWRRLDISEEDIAGGVQVLGGEGDVIGRFATVPELFSMPVVDIDRTRVSRGEGRLALVPGPPSYFEVETLLMGIPGTEESGSILVGVRKRPLGLVAEGEERLWTQLDRGGTSERAGRLGGDLFVRIYDEAYGLLALPLNPTVAPAPPTVPLPVVEELRETGSSGVWFRRGWWFTGGADEFYFRLEARSVSTPVPGAAVGEMESVERLACIGVGLPGLWGRVVEAMNVLILFTVSLLVLAWFPAAIVEKTGIPVGRLLRRVSFQTRLLIPLLVVALVPLIALWLLTQGFILNRERSAWEESLDRSVQDVQNAISEQTRARAEELVSASMQGGGRGITDSANNTLWALFDANLIRVAGTLPDSLADRIPLRHTVLGRGPESFFFRSGRLWSIALAPIGSRFSNGAALVARPFSEDLLREAASGSPWQVDLYVDGHLRYSTEPGPYTASLLPNLLPREADWHGLRGREVGALKWGALNGLHYLFAYRPMTDYTGTAVATIAQRRFGLWGLSDPGLNNLFTTVASIYLLLVIAVTLVAVLVARRISQPIGDLTSSAGRVAGGDLEVEIPVTRGDEVGGLQKAFRQMVIALRENREELARAERERAWQEMARQVAHEIKNPLTPMQLSAQFLRRAFDEGAEDLGKIIRECTNAIVEQVEGLRRIANEFSAYARLPVVRRIPTDLNEPVEDALNLFEPALPDEVVIERELAGDIPAVLLDAEQVRRVAINLIRNALDAMGEEGVLRVRTGSDNAGVWLQIADTGEGIAPEVQERLFEPYFSTKTDGTGLGLAITRSIIDAYGGTLSVESRPGEGTTVTAHFPFE